MQLARLNFRRHFLLLACALAVIVILAQLDLFGAASLLPDAAIYGALHAIAIAGALEVPATLKRKSLFIVAAAALDVIALYVGILTLGLLARSTLGMALRAYLAFAVSATVGAIFYGLLLRGFWLRNLHPRPIAQIALTCLCATVLTVVGEHAVGASGLWPVAAVWWCAFSGGLRFFGRAYALRPHPDA